MSRKQIIYIILIAFFVGALGSIVLGRFALPYLSKFPGLSWLSKLTTTSPIVINRSEVVQLNDGANLQDLIKQTGNITVSILDANNNFLGNGIIVTADGLIFTSDSILRGLTKVKVVTNDGKIFEGLARAKDPKSALVIVSIESNNLPVAQFESAANMDPGQRIIYLGRGNVAFQHFARTGFVTQNLANQTQIAKQLSTDVATTADLIGGPIINLSGHVVAMALDGNQNIISENLQTALASYLANGKIK
jgi:S1-C subfamily serine protease